MGPVKKTKSDKTKDKILIAARAVFARHPYHAASMRMIGKEGDFDHPIIRYHFPSKARLFETVISDICDEFYTANLQCYKGLEGIPPEQGFSQYIDRLIKYSNKNSESLSILMLNIAHSDTGDEEEKVPGYSKIPEFFARTRATFNEKVPVKASDEEVERYLDSFNTLLVSYLGASSCHASILGIKPNSTKYRSWVKKTLTFLFLSKLKRLIYGDDYRHPQTHS